MTDTVPLLRLDSVCKSFGRHQVLRGVDLRLDTHEVVALIGSSGSGKSTLLRCVNLLEAVDDGTVELDGRDITDPRVDADAVRREIGMVFQAYNLFPHMSVLDNVTLAPRRLRRLPRAEADASARLLLRRFGLEDKVAVHPDQLSGGQQQRVALAQALAMQPRLLLLDEITSALDPELVGEVLEAINDLKQQGMTILMATHEMAFAREVADRMVFLDEGVVLEEGPPVQLLDAPRHERTAAFLRRFRTAAS
ncbi:MAG: amino acid ABC transporter ATP-binding protein [Nocardioidaceae bacterium]|nr:amino acid ABC transporter ATP-binding protein [Nocardioidaceae bacterium]